MIPFASEEELFAGAAERVAASIREAVKQRGLHRLVLSGGSTPRRLYQELSSSFADLPWSRVEFYFGDERCVPPEDASSNFAMAFRALLEPLSIEPGRYHRMLGELGAQAGAQPL